MNEMFKLALANASRHVLLRSKVLVRCYESILHFLSMNNVMGKLQGRGTSWERVNELADKKHYIKVIHCQSPFFCLEAIPSLMTVWSSWSCSYAGLAAICWVDLNSFIVCEQPLHACIYVRSACCVYSHNYGHPISEYK